MKKEFKNIFALLIVAISFTSCTKNVNWAEGQINQVINLNYVKALHNGNDITLQPEKLMGATQISGVVISDRSSDNFESNEIVIQNTNKGITSGLIVKLNNENNSVDFGDSVKVQIQDCTLFREKGSLKVKGANLDISKVQKISSNNAITQKVLTQSQLLSDFYKVESTMIRVENISFPNLIGGELYGGEYRINDDVSIPLFLNTKMEAKFAKKFLPMAASFLVVPTYNNLNSDFYNSAKMILKMPNEDAAFDETGSVYANFPEDFELAPASSKSSYLMPVINDQAVFKTGAWKIYQGIIGATVNVDKYNPMGKQAIRFQQQLSESAYLEMLYDLPNGASKITFTYGVPALGTIVGSSIDLEYSTDKGVTWVKVGSTITDATKDAKEASFNVNIRNEVRFRINKLGLGKNTSTISNGYLNIDDFKVYQNVD